MSGSPPARRWRDLADLGGVRDALAAADRERDRIAAEAAAAAARAAADRTLFERSVGPVRPISAAARALVAGDRPPPEPRQRQRDDRAVLAEAIGAGVIDGDALLETDDAMSWRRRGVGPDVVRKLRRGAWATQAEIDLHGLRRDAARDRLREFLARVTQGRLRCVRIVHGKGLGSPGGEGVLKADTKAWLSRRAEVIAWTHARAADGGHGALVVLLRAEPPSPPPAAR